MRVTCEATDPVWRLRLEPGPEGQVSLGPETIAALAAAIDRCAESPGCRVVVLRSAGPGFCGGMDLKTAVTASRDEVDASLRAFAGALERLLALPAATVAVVEGAASGGGVGLAAACDLVVAGPEASFSLPELRLGLVPAVILPALLQRLSPQRIRRLALAGEALTPAQAEAWGLVDAVAEDPARASASLVKTLLRARPAAVATLKRITREDARGPLAAALQAGVDQTAADLADPEVRSALAALLHEGAAPGWFARPGGQV